MVNWLPRRLNHKVYNQNPYCVCTDFSYTDFIFICRSFNMRVNCRCVCIHSLCVRLVCVWKKNYVFYYIFSGEFHIILYDLKKNESRFKFCVVCVFCVFFYLEWCCHLMEKKCNSYENDCMKYNFCYFMYQPEFLIEIFWKTDGSGSGPFPR